LALAALLAGCSGGISQRSAMLEIPSPPEARPAACPAAPAGRAEGPRDGETLAQYAARLEAENARQAAAIRRLRACAQNKKAPDGVRWGSDQRNAA